MLNKIAHWVGLVAVVLLVIEAFTLAWRGVHELSKTALNQPIIIKNYVPACANPDDASEHGEHETIL